VFGFFFRDLKLLMVGYGTGSPAESQKRICITCPQRFRFRAGVVDHLLRATVSTLNYDRYFVSEVPHEGQIDPSLRLDKDGSH